MNNQDIMCIAMQQSAYDCNCNANDFVKQENIVKESVPNDKARRYLELPLICDLVSYGTNIVACGWTDLLPEIKRVIHSMPAIENCFETPGLYALNSVLKKVNAEICFMADYFLPDIDAVYTKEFSTKYEIKVLEPNDFTFLYRKEWKNALCAYRKHLDILAVGAYEEEKLVGLAGCSADCEMMWQIGVDVLPEYRQQGIASALTNRLAREIFERDKVPFYCAAWSNVKSVRNAITSGFRPGWVEVTAKSIDFVDKMMKQ